SRIAVPEVPAVPGTAGLIAATDAAFAEAGAIARAVGGDFEPRPAQRTMAAAVADALVEGGTLVVEAGTGTGKTVAYLAPAILSGKRVLISTGTKNLQEQIFFKDLPALRDALGVPFTATLMKGRANYLCLHRWALYRDAVEGETSVGGRLIESGDRVLLPILDAWVRKTETGDRAELRDLPEDVPLWKEIAADAETCLGAECPRYGDCFITLMRQRAAESDVVIVNHHLLCADAAVRQGAYGEVIPSCSTLVVDEAHQLEDAATQYFGVAFTSHRVDDLVRDAARMLAAPGSGRPADASDEAALTPSQHEEISRALARVAERSRVFFSGLALARPFAALPGGETRARYTAETMADHAGDALALAGALDALEGAIALALARAPREGGAAAREEIVEAAAAIQRRAGELRDDLRFLVRAGDPDFVYYLEARPHGGIVLKAAPIDVSRVVREALFDRYRTVVLTSATLSVDESFEYVKGRLGIRAAAEIRVPSEFDYARQALLYLPARMPPPGSSAFATAVAREASQLLQHSRGRAFVLFTSYSVLRAVQQVLQMTLPYPLLVQGTAPRSTLVEQFRRTPNAVLLATSSFWQGVDVVGEALSCVIIDKLPFASPADPVTAARIDAIRERGGDPFTEYQVPLAILTLLQGLGRLIRHRTDRGVLAVLDPRLTTKRYGRRFLASLPPAPVTHDLRAVERFFM
ncbi:MAG TPA: ATP-dependent DNA helicase, partial [Vicinamibacterales bacterium]|nr:ATP-dependent DNA helicase [Vicinamibacterales bacterium]